ncbi:MAG TPA: glycosyltransferase [Acidobacteriaceae bacterium]|jgi:glycosyltransferase involved in cell wall biosynthesis
MRILHFIASVDSATGGPVEGLKQRCAIYKTGGHEVEIASLDSPEFVLTSNFPAKVVGLGPGRGVYGYSPHAVRWLKANVNRFDVVFVNGVWNYNTLAAHRALAGTDIPWAIFTHGMLDPYFKKQYPLKHLKKVLYWHTMLGKAFRDATAVLFTCEEEKILARQSFARYKVREAVVPYGTFGPNCDTALASEEFLARCPELRGKRLAICLGRIHPKKGTDILIESFAGTLASDPAWHLVIAGPDKTGWRKDLEALATRLGVANRITWTGSLAGTLKWGAFSASEVFVLPSHQENFGIVVAEAMACGLPVIVSNKVNIWREIANYNAGLVGEDTIEGTKSLLLQWSALSPEEIAAFRSRSKKCFEEMFDFNRTSQLVLDNVEQLARSTARYKPSVPVGSASAV